MSDKKTVLVTATNYSALCVEGKRLLEDAGFAIVENTFGRPMTFDELKQRVGDVSAAVVGVDAWNDAVFRIAPNLKVLSRFGVGVDNIDIETARKYGIQVCNAAGMNANAVAELTLGLLLATLRHIPQLDGTTKTGHWDRFVGEELEGCKVGILGFGNIAQKVAKKLSGFDVAVSAYDKFPNQAAAAALNVHMAGWEEILQESDIVVMLLPSLPETKRFMNAKTFGMMKDKSYFINTARGALVDELALRDALVSGKLAAAAIDVYEKEPSAADNPLFKLPNVLTTPHTAAETYEAYRNIGVHTARTIIDVFAGKKPANLL